MSDGNFQDEQPGSRARRDGAGPGLPPFRPLAGVTVNAEAVTAAAAATVKVTTHFLLFRNDSAQSR